MNQRANEYDLNDAQFEQLMDKYIMTIDSMSTEDSDNLLLILTMMTCLIIHY